MAKTRVAQPSTPADDRVLREQVERVVAEQLGADREIVGYDKTLFPHIGSYDCHTVSVQLAGGDAFRRTEDEVRQHTEKLLASLFPLID